MTISDQRRREALTRQMAQEHEEVREGVQVIEEALADEGSAGSAQGVLERLRRLSAHLRSHFQLEETGGLFGEYGNTNETIRRTVDRLVEQHREFEARLDGVLAHLEQAARSSAEVPQSITTTIRELIADVRRHELEENELFQGIVLRDVGGRG